MRQFLLLDLASPREGGGRYERGEPRDVEAKVSQISADSVGFTIDLPSQLGAVTVDECPLKWILGKVPGNLSNDSFGWNRSGERSRDCAFTPRGLSSWAVTPRGLNGLFEVRVRGMNTSDFENGFCVLWERFF